MVLKFAATRALSMKRKPMRPALEVQILRRRKNKAVHPMVMDRLSRLPRKLMPRMFKGFKAISPSVLMIMVL